MNPDSSQELELLRQEILQLREAVKRRTEELEVEACLERVRTIAMKMTAPADMLDVCHTISDQLQALGVTNIRNVQTAIFNDEKGTYLNYEYFAQYDTTSILEIVTQLHPALEEFARSIRSARDAYFTTSFSGTELEDWIEYRKKTNQNADPLLERAPSVHYYFYSIGPGALGLSTYAPLSDEHLEAFKRFRNVFDLAYRRFLDIEQAEAQTREAQIEAALERVRSRAMAMRTSTDLSATSGLVFTELRKLGITSVRCGVVLLTEATRQASVYYTSSSTDKDELAYIGTLNLSGHPSLERQYAQWLKREDYLVTLRGDEVAAYYEWLRIEMPIPFLPREASEQEEHGYYLYFSEGQFYAWTRERYTDEQLAILNRFKATLELTFRRYLELQRAEAQTRQAQLDLIQLQAEKKRAEDALSVLRETQAQLLHQEKLASLGQLTAGIAHEIKNPLNFVNNFSSVSLELLDEAMHEIAATAPEAMKGDARQLLGDVRTNLTKIVQHGTRADGIVKSMLQHSRGGSGRKEPTDLNALVREFANLAFHGMRAAKHPINVDMVLDLQDPMEKVSVVAEDFSRVIINLCQNSFDAMREKLDAGAPSRGPEAYLPKLTVRTRSDHGRVRLEIRDNGPGIPGAIRAKILQPFFTTKKGTQGTGLGLSITHDIVKAHGGALTIEDNPDGGATFVVELPSDSRSGQAGSV